MDFNPRAPYGARPHTGRDCRHVHGFQSTRPIRGATRWYPISRLVVLISIHAPHTGRDWLLRKVSRLFDISIHAPHTGRDLFPGFKYLPEGQISIHAPHTGRDAHRGLISPRCVNFNPRAPYGARRTRSWRTGFISAISIHAPHTGRDSDPQLAYKMSMISIHAPHTGRDDGHRQRRGQRIPFQSTRPIRGATDISSEDYKNLRAISIHAPHTGRDNRGLSPRKGKKIFQSTRPIRGATPGMRQYKQRELRISIHAPHTGRDPISGEASTSISYFNPRAPYGARLLPAADVRRHTDNFNPRAPYGARRVNRFKRRLIDLFQSTRPIRGATGKSVTAFSGASP